MIRAGESRSGEPRVGQVRGLELGEHSDPLAPLSDELNGSVLSSRWTIYKPASIVVTPAGDVVTVAPVAGSSGPTGSLWYATFDGGLVSQRITGNFQATLTLQVFNEARSGPPVQASGQWRFGILSAQDPDRTTVFNYIHCAVGTADEFPGTFLAEWKDCRDSVSPYSGVPIAYTHAQLRMTRRVQQFTLEVRPITGGAWTLIRDIDRSGHPLPSALDVGFGAYDATADDDISADFSQFDVRTP